MEKVDFSIKKWNTTIDLMAIVAFRDTVWQHYWIIWDYLKALMFYAMLIWNVNTVRDSTMSDICLYL